MKAKIVGTFMLVWLSIAIASVLYNAIKIPYELKEWLGLSSYEKKVKIFGEIYELIDFISRNTEEKSRVLILSPDNKSFYLSAYYLYPRIIHTAADEKELLEKMKTYKTDYILAIKNNFLKDKYKTVKTFTTERGLVFKLLKRDG